ncbi:MAG: methyltransferase domain-containing protein [Nitrospinales bacterium]
MIKKSKKSFKKSHTKPRNQTKKAGSSAVWDQAARWYDALVGMKGSEYQQQVVLPGVWRLLNMKKGNRLLDLACGQGVFSRYAKEKGIKVTGVDISTELVRHAISRSGHGIEYHSADAGDQKILNGKKYNGIVCILAIQNIENIIPVFQNVKRLLSPTGCFVLAMTHPCFRIPRQSHWSWDEGKKIMGRTMDMYSSETNIPLMTPPVSGSKGFTVTYHRPLQTYVKALSDAGLQIDMLEEWASHKTSEPGKRSRGENRARAEFPLFMAIRAVPASISGSQEK